MVRRVLIVGTGLIGASIGLALRAAGFNGEIIGTGADEETLTTALGDGSDRLVASARRPRTAVAAACRRDCAGGPVMSILDWMQRLAPVLGEHQLVTDVGSTKLQIAELAARLLQPAGRRRDFCRDIRWRARSRAARRWPRRAIPECDVAVHSGRLQQLSALETEWRGWVAKFGARTMDLDPARHDEICAWVSHLPQMLSTALAALLEETFAAIRATRGDCRHRRPRAAGDDAAGREPVQHVARHRAFEHRADRGRRCIALEQRLAHLRENLRTPELKEELAWRTSFGRGVGS